jgi:hypothetical protein
MQPTITRVIETQDLSDQGKSIQSVRVEFKVGDHGPFSVSVPKAGFSSAAVNQKVSEFVSHLSGLTGIK